MAKKKEQKQETQRTDQSKKVTQETQKTSFKNAIPTQASPKAKDIHGKSSGKNPPLKPLVKANSDVVHVLTPSPATWYQSSQGDSRIVGKDKVNMGFPPSNSQNSSGMTYSKIKNDTRKS